MEIGSKLVSVVQNISKLLLLMSTKTTLQCIIRNKKLLLLMPKPTNTSQNLALLKPSQNHWQRLPLMALNYLAAITIGVDWEYDCGYEGDVNREDSDTEYQPGSSSDDSQWDAESLDELSGDSDELESNLQQQCELLAEVAALTVPTPYSQITAPKTKDKWAKVEQNQALGYIGNLMRSKSQNVQDTHDWEEFQKKT